MLQKELFIQIKKGNVCRHYKVGYCKLSIECRHKHIKNECKVNDCNKKRIKRHIRICRYGARCKKIGDCELKHVEKEQNIENNKRVEKNNTEQAGYKSVKCSNKGATKINTQIQNQNPKDDRRKTENLTKILCQKQCCSEN